MCHSSYIIINIHSLLIYIYIFCFQVKGPILVEQLFQIVSCNLPEHMWTNLFNTPTQLMSFLRLFSDSFHIQSNLVTLLQPPKINQKHIHTQILLVKENNDKNNEELKKKQIIVNNNNNFNEVSAKEPTSLTIPEKKVIKSSPRSVSDRLIKPPIKKSLSVTEGTKSESLPKSMSPEPAVNLTSQQSNGEILRKPIDLTKSDSPKKSLSPEPPVSSNNQIINSVATQDERSRGVNFRLGK